MMSPISDYINQREISIDEHVRQSHAKLSKSLRNMHAIYLDTKYWILLRDAQQEQCDEPAAKLLMLLKEGVFEGRWFCPIGESTLVEVMKQADPSSRLATAKLIDELSLGVALIDENSRISAEVLHLLYSSVGEKNLYDLEELVWTKLSYLLGIMHPSDTVFEPNTELAIQKAFFDHMSSVSLVTMIEPIDALKPSDINLDHVAQKLNLNIAAHADSLRSFQQTYEAEAYGVTDIDGGIFDHFLLAMKRREGIADNLETTKARQVVHRQYKNLLAVSLVKNKSRETLRTMHILASLHSSLRWNKGRKISGNDLLDFKHAAAALAYCDVFLTERSLHTLVTQNHLSLDTLFNCQVVSDTINSIAVLNNLTPQVE